MDNDNVIEFIKGEKRATAYFSQSKYINKIKKLASKNEDCEVIENKDGSIVSHFPVSWIKISPPRKVSEEQRLAAGERMKNYQRTRMAKI